MIVPSSQRRWRAARPAAGLCMAVLLAAGCTTDRVTTSDGRPLPPQPRQAPPTPPQAKVNRMAFIVGSKPDDTNNNGCPDLIRVTVALFAAPHPTAIRQDGAFEFTLSRQGESGLPGVPPIGVWQVAGTELERSFAHAQYGPCYQFQLSLFEVGGDQLALDRADLVCRFIPVDGSPPVVSDGVRTIQIGCRSS